MVDEALEAGIRTVQLRDKDAPTGALLETADRLARLCRRQDALFIVNDRVDVAMASGAGGVHLGQEDMPVGRARELMGGEAVIGASVRTVAEAARAEEEGADYLAANMVFATPTKTDLPGPLGLEAVSELRRGTRLPLVAIGGLGPGNAGLVLDAGADGVAVVSAIMSAGDVPLACRELIRACGRYGLQ